MRARSTPISLLSLVLPGLKAISNPTYNSKYHHCQKWKNDDSTRKKYGRTFVVFKKSPDYHGYKQQFKEAGGCYVESCHASFVIHPLRPAIIVWLNGIPHNLRAPEARPAR
jgi:hypothetical protein